MAVINIDIYELLFEGLFRLEQCVGDQSWGCFNNDFQHDFVFALFIPHIVLATFFYIAFRGLGNRGIEALLGIGGYVFMIQMGWYPIFSTLTLVWMSIAILFAFYFFILSKIIHPAKAGAYGQAARHLSRRLKAMDRGNMTEAEIIQEMEREIAKTENPALRLMLMKELKKIKEED